MRVTNRSSPSGWPVRSWRRTRSAPSFDSPWAKNSRQSSRRPTRGATRTSRARTGLSSTQRAARSRSLPSIGREPVRAWQHPTPRAPARQESSMVSPSTQGHPCSHAADSQDPVLLCRRGQEGALPRFSHAARAVARGVATWPPRARPEGEPGPRVRPRPAEPQAMAKAMAALPLASHTSCSREVKCPPQNAGRRRWRRPGRLTRR